MVQTHRAQKALSDLNDHLTQLEAIHTAAKDVIDLIEHHSQKQKDGHLITDAVGVGLEIPSAYANLRDLIKGLHK